MINYTLDHLRTEVAVAKANKYTPMPQPSDVVIEGYDPNFSASTNAINFRLNQEVEVDTGRNGVLMTRILYPMMWFYIFVGLYYLL